MEKQKIICKYKLKWFMMQLFWVYFVYFLHYLFILFVRTILKPTIPPIHKPETNSKKPPD